MLIELIIIIGVISLYLDMKKYKVPELLVWILIVLVIILYLYDDYYLRTSRIDSKYL